ncbi:MAG: T9SS sorting signal type C domain-containing protein, partial [Flavobacteriaceae bacterium]
DQAGSFTISLSDFDGIFAENQNIYLRDNSTQTEHNLKDGNYSFVSQQGTFNSRFEVVYKQSGALDITNPDLNNNWIVYKQNDVFHIYSRGFEMKEVTVYDILGRKVYEATNINASNHTFPTVNANQMLIVKILSTDNQSLTKKVKN